MSAIAIVDAFRVVIFLLFAFGAGFMLVTNIIAYRVLRPPRRIGFLWWHVTAVSVSVLCFGAVALDRVIGQLHQPLTWRTPTVLLGCVLFAVSQAIIFRVERQRLVEKVARRAVGGS